MDEIPQLPAAPLTTEKPPSPPSRPPTTAVDAGVRVAGAPAAVTPAVRKRVLVGHPHGFCAGVRRALKIIETAALQCSGPLYCLNELVHNRQVVDDLTARGIRFVTRIDAIPAGSTVVFSAHGVSPAIREQAKARQLRVIDATCPFVAKVHDDVRRYAREGYSVLLIGSPMHDEVIGVAGEAPESVLIVANARDAERVQPGNPEHVTVATQTTLSAEQVRQVMAVLEVRFPTLQMPDKSGICYATTDRQEAVRHLARAADLVLVLGSENSANSNRLVDVARGAGTDARLVPSLQALLDSTSDWQARGTLGLTAGASTPEHLVEAAIDILKSRGFETVETLSVAEETLTFPTGLPDCRARHSLPLNTETFAIIHAANGGVPRHEHHPNV
jgi:4-hydroxy-3-methylbut-2-enyl diphosphate reductase